MTTAPPTRPSSCLILPTSLSGSKGNSCIIVHMDLPAEFRPERFSRRGEITAWGLALLAFLAWGWTMTRGFETPAVLKFVALFCVLAGLAISLSNWSDRRTRLRLEPDGVAFENGLRRVRLAWDEIREMRVFPSNLGDQVRVIGEQTFFMFRTL